MRSPVRHQRRLFLSASLGLLLGACGGGSEDDAGGAREDPSARASADSRLPNGAPVKRRRRARPYARTGVTAIVASPDGSSVGVAYADGRVRLLDGTGVR